MIHIYRLLTFFYLIFILPIKFFLFSETRSYLNLRLKETKKTRTRTKPSNLKTYLFHASSGEAEYAFPIIREIKNKFPDSYIIMTYFSNSYLDVVQANKDINLVVPLPLDLPSPCFSFLKSANPNTIFISRTDLWPEFLLQAKKLKIPVVLFSRTQTPINNPLKRKYYKWLYKFLNLISVVTQEDKNNVLKIDPDANVLVHGDSRWDQVQFKLSQNPSVQYLKPTFVAGSIWPEDFNFLSNAWSRKFGQLIIVPHESNEEFFKKIKKYFSEKGYILKFLSEWDFKFNFEKLNVDFDVLVVDQFGVLPRLYQYSYASFIGGSFKKKVHSVMESLVSNTPVIVGPFNQNNREAQIFKKVLVEPDSDICAVNVANTSQEIRNLIYKIYTKHSKTKPQFIDIGGNVSENLIKDVIIDDKLVKTP